MPVNTFAIPVAGQRRDPPELETPHPKRQCADAGPRTGSVTPPALGRSSSMLLRRMSSLSSASEAAAATLRPKQPAAATPQPATPATRPPTPPTPPADVPPGLGQEDSAAAAARCIWAAPPLPWASITPTFAADSLVTSLALQSCFPPIAPPRPACFDQPSGTDPCFGSLAELMAQGAKLHYTHTHGDQLWTWEQTPTQVTSALSSEARSALMSSSAIIIGKLPKQYSRGTAEGGPTLQRRPSVLAQPVEEAVVVQHAPSDSEDEADHKGRETREDGAEPSVPELVASLMQLIDGAETSGSSALRWFTCHDLAADLSAAQQCVADDAQEAVSRTVAWLQENAAPPAGASAAGRLRWRAVNLALCSCVLELCARQPLHGADVALDIALDAAAAGRREAQDAVGAAGNAQAKADTGGEVDPAVLRAAQRAGRVANAVDKGLRMVFTAVRRLSEGGLAAAGAERVAAAAVRGIFAGEPLASPALELLGAVCSQHPSVRPSVADEVAEGAVSGCDPGSRQVNSAVLLVIPAVDAGLRDPSPMRSPTRKVRRVVGSSVHHDRDGFSGSPKRARAGSRGLRTLASVLLILAHSVCGPTEKDDVVGDAAAAVRSAASVTEKVLRITLLRVFAEWRVQRRDEKLAANSLLSDLVDDLITACGVLHFPAAPLVLGVVCRMCAGYAAKATAQQQQLRIACLGAVGRIARAGVSMQTAVAAAERRLQHYVSTAPALADPSQWLSTLCPSVKVPGPPVDTSGVECGLGWPQGAALVLLSAPETDADGGAAAWNFILCACIEVLRSRAAEAPASDAPASDAGPKKAERRKRSAPEPADERTALTHMLRMVAALRSRRAAAEPAAWGGRSHYNDVATWSCLAVPASPFRNAEDTAIKLLAVLARSAVDSQASVACRRRALSEMSRLLSMAAECGNQRIASHGVQLLRRALSEPSATIRAAGLDLVPVVRRTLAKGNPGSTVAVGELLTLLSTERSSGVIRRALAMLRRVAQSAASAVRVHIVHTVLESLGPLITTASNDNTTQSDAKLRDDVVTVVRTLWLTPASAATRERVVNELGAVLLLKNRHDPLLAFDPQHPMVSILRAAAAQGASDQMTAVASAARAHGGASALAVTHCLCLGYPQCLSSTADFMALAHHIGAGAAERPAEFHHAVGAFAASCKGHAAAPLLGPGLGGEAGEAVGTCVGHLARMLRGLSDSRLLSQACHGIGAAAAALRSQTAPMARVLHSVHREVEGLLRVICGSLPAPKKRLVAARLLNRLFIVAELVRSFPWAHPALCRRINRVSTPEAVLEFVDDGPLQGVRELLQTAEDRLKYFGTAERGRLLAMIIRVFGALCSQQPLVYWRQSEALFQKALEADGPATQQALEGLREFLQDEAQQMEKQSKGKVDYDSGLGGLLAQRFLPSVMDLCLSAPAATRRQAVRLMCLIADMGLCIPTTVAATLAALTADSSQANAMEAEMTLLAVARRTKGQLHVHAVSGWPHAFALHTEACEVEPADAFGFDLDAGVSRHAALWRVVLTVPREAQGSALRQVLKLLHDTRMVRATREDPPDATAASIADELHRIRFLAESVAWLPFSRRWEVLLLVTEIADVLDLQGIVCLDNARAQAGSDVRLWLQACGLWHLVMMKYALTIHHQVTVKELQRYAEAPLSRTLNRPLRSPDTNAALEHFSAAAVTFCRAAAKRLTCEPEQPKKASARRRKRPSGAGSGPIHAGAWGVVCSELEVALHDDAVASAAAGTRKKGLRRRRADGDSDSDSDADTEEKAERAKLSRIRMRLMTKVGQKRIMAAERQPRIDLENLVSSGESSSDDDSSSDDESSSADSESNSN